MLYQKYKQHLTKRWKLFEKLWHFRFLILLILVLVIALTVTLLAITGNVSLVSCPETVEYGSAYAPEGHAIFRQSTVQYRAKGAPESAWTEERPIVIGSYEARAVSRSFSQEGTG